MKKAFTLIEMLIVVTIIGILLSLISFLSWSYISKLNVQGEKETLIGNFFYIQSMSLSQPKFGKIDNVKYIGIKLSPNKDYIKDIVFTGDNFSKYHIIDLMSFSYIKLGTGFKVYSGTILKNIINKDVIFLYKPYSLGVTLLEDNGGTYNLLTGNYTIKFSIDSIYGIKGCFQVNLESGRLYATDCK